MTTESSNFVSAFAPQTLMAEKTPLNKVDVSYLFGESSHLKQAIKY